VGSSDLMSTPMAIGEVSGSIPDNGSPSLARFYRSVVESLAFILIGL
jgi:hypothetical protein